MTKSRTPSVQLYTHHYKAIAMLRKGAFERRSGAWRFGTRTIGDSVVRDLIAAERAVRVGGDRIETTMRTKVTS